MKNRFIEAVNDLGLDLSNKQLKQFERYFELLVEWNEKINLTAITEREEVFLKHFYDSLCLVKAVNLSNQTLLDVGSGAGFPSIPLKIVFPDLQITIIDALQKRIKFLGLLSKEIEIEVELIHGRAEEFANKNYYDLVTARAVANLQMLSELCIPFVKKDGYFISLKGPKYKEEIELCSNAFDILKVHLEDVVLYQIDNDNRSILKLRKYSESSNKYPRKFSKIKSKPL